MSKTKCKFWDMRVWMWGLVPFFLLACNEEDLPVEEPEGPIERTVLMYVVADNNLSSFAEDDLEEVRLGMANIPATTALFVYMDKAYGNPAIVFAIFMKYKDIPVFESTCYYGYSIVTTMVQNAVRTIPLGQKSGQRIMHDIFDVVLKLCEEISQLDERYLGANVPGIEMSQIRHETTVFRLFMS